MSRVIFFCKYGCKSRWAFDYPLRRKVSRGYGRFETIAFREFNGCDVTPVRDAWCRNNCRKDVTMTTVKGFVTDHACDARCEAATGSNCDCACGGKNHGKAFMCVAA